MNFAYGLAVGVGFRLCDEPIDGLGIPAHLLGYGKMGDEMGNIRQAGMAVGMGMAVAVVRMGMAVAVVRMGMAVAVVGMGMAVAVMRMGMAAAIVGMGMAVAVVGMSMLAAIVGGNIRRVLFLAVHQHPHMRAPNAAFLCGDRLNLHARNAKAVDLL